MSMTVHGFGVATYGRAGMRVTEGVCPRCRTRQRLLSYRGNQYIVFVYVPVLSLGRRYIIDECSRCGTPARVLRSAEYDARRTGVLSEAIAAVREDPEDATVLQDAVDASAQPLPLLAGETHRAIPVEQQTDIDPTLSMTRTVSAPNVVRNRTPMGKRTKWPNAARIPAWQ